MEELLKGIVKFRENAYQKNRELFMSLKDRQAPHTLFICCSDSRLDPNMITGSLPGELFTIRVIANIIPPFEKSEEHAALASAIEYAVKVLTVKNIVVCGHSNCGGCAAISEPPAFLEKWLDLSRQLREKTTKDLKAEVCERALLIERANVLEQVNNLLSFPYICDEVIAGTLNISAWHYIIETGEIFIYDESSDSFKPAN